MWISDITILNVSLDTLELYSHIIHFIHFNYQQQMVTYCYTVSDTESEWVETNFPQVMCQAHVFEAC